MIRTKVKGTRYKAASSPDQEPDFYSMPPVIVSPNSSPLMAPQSNPAIKETIPEVALSPVNELFALFRDSLQQQSSFSNVLQSSLFPSSQPQAPASPKSNQVLEDAVEELFTSGEISAMDDLDDFVNDWDPTSSNVAKSLENDLQLGYMLDRLLSD